MSVVDNINWKTLRAQKRTLINKIFKAGKAGKDLTVDHLTGILHLIDAIQDEAAVENRVQVFGYGFEED